MKFSYCRVVRRKPVGLPVVMIMPALTQNVSGAQLTFTQRVRSLPLNIGTKPSSPAGMARGQHRSANRRRKARRITHSLWKDDWTEVMLPASPAETGEIRQLANKSAQVFLRLAFSRQDMLST